MNLKKQITDQYPKVLSFAIKLSQDKMIAEDIAQETMIKALRNVDNYKEKNQLISWLLMITRNTFINHYRRIKTGNQIFDHKADSQNVGILASENADSNLLEKEIFSIFDKLPSDNKRIIKMYMDGWKYKEIAEEFDLPIGTIKSKIFTARKFLKQKYN